MSHRVFKEKFFCQVCNRQCQDKDGFKCHLNSSTHRKNIERVAKNPEKYIEEYSSEFMKGYLDVIRREDQWVSANVVYDKYIKEKGSVGLNTTKWESLAKFLEFISKEKKVKLEPKENDILIKYIDKEIEDKKEKKEEDTSMKKLERITKEAKRRNEKDIKEKKEIKEVDITKLNGFSIELKPSIPIIDIPIQNKSEPSLLSKKRKSSDNNSWVSKGLKVNILNSKFQKGKIKNVKDNKVDLIIVDTSGKQKTITVDISNITPKTPSIGSLCKVINGEYVNDIGVVQNITDTKCSFKSSSTKKIYSIDITHLCKYKPL